MATKPRDYKAEYEKYQGTPAQIKKRSERNQARRVFEKAHGNLPSNVDVDHKKALSKGGAPTKLSNLRAASEAENTSFSRTKTGAMKSQVSKRERKK
jgi:5-methylcytosine-specific restriction endonuclease McrA